jgi:hypothetical protein
MLLLRLLEEWQLWVWAMLDGLSHSVSGDVFVHNHLQALVIIFDLHQGGSHDSITTCVVWRVKAHMLYLILNT